MDFSHAKILHIQAALAQIFLSRFFSLLSSLSLRYIVFFFLRKRGRRGSFFLKKNSGGLVALDGALKKFHQKRKRKMRVIVFSFFVLFLSGQEKCGVGNHAFFRPMNKIVFFSSFFYLHMVLREEEKFFLKFFFWIIF